jgi:hypothetical protein
MSAEAKRPQASQNARNAEMIVVPRSHPVGDSCFELFRTSYGWLIVGTIELETVEAEHRLKRSDEGISQVLP